MDNSSGFASLSDAARTLRVGKEQVRRYVQRGMLPATKIANSWVIPWRELNGFRDRKPNGGRPLSRTAAWDAIFNDDIDLSDPFRYINRGDVSRWYGSIGAMNDMTC